MRSSDDAVTRIAVASLLDDFYPPGMRRTLLSRESFRSKYDFEVDVQVSFGETGISVSRSSLFSCIRTALNASDEEKREIKDQSENNWLLEVVDAASGKIRLSGDGRSLVLPDFWMFIENDGSRLSNFEHAATDVNLPAASRNYWTKRLKDSPLSDGEVDGLLQDLSETPVNVIRRITAEVKEGHSKFESLVPRSARYFHRLAGEWEQQVDLKSYVQNVLRAHIGELVAWEAAEGIKLALLLSAHSSIPPEINLDRASDDELTVFEEVARNGDRLSQLGAIELGLSVLDKYPQLEPAIVSMVEQIRDDNPDSKNSRFRLLSALIVLVEGEISLTKTLEGRPPFWRRLATIAQASLIERCIYAFPVDIGSFTEWAYSGRGQQFYMQTLCDMRAEPKWMPDLISPEQLKAEFVGRIAHAAELHKDKMTSQAIRDLTLEKTDVSIRHQVSFPEAFFPGPLEGNSTSEVEMPQDFTNLIDEALSKESVDGKSFVGLVNSALLFKLDIRFADQAVYALQRAKHYLKQGTEPVSLFHLLSGLASVAAVTRSPQLAEELRVLIRRSKAAGAIDITAENLFRIGMIASASRAELHEWCSCVGEWTTELAYSDLSHDESARLHAHVKCLCSIVPELWTTLGRAEAALASLSR
ncbi:MAG: hypothetical protein RH982_10950 [Parvibaculum sp.]